MGALLLGHSLGFISAELLIFRQALSEWNWISYLGSVVVIVTTSLLLPRTK